ncbi:MAG: recombinase family protein [Caldilineaceae bacterium]
MARKYVKESKTAKQLALDTGCTALYVRVSTELQATEGYSLEAQQKQLEAYAFAHGWIVCPDQIYIDAGVSGKSTNREQFQRMLQAAQEGTIRRIVAMKLDRMARNVREFLATVDQLREWGCDLVLVKESFDTSTPHGRFALTMFAAMAELEASTITERVMSGKAQKATTGGYNGSRCPYGYTYADNVFTINPEQADVIRHIFAMFNAGKSLNAITRELNETATPTATGKDTWFVNGVKHVLSNGAYAGVGQWNGVETDSGKHPAIVDRNTYDQAQSRLQSLSRGQRVDLQAA